VQQVFPRKDELHLLAHVRKVDVADTELAGNDDDGVVAVLLSHRLPQPGVAYRACLVSLEGQFDVLADPAPPAAPVDDRPVKGGIYSGLPAGVLQAARFGRTGNPAPLVATNQPSTAPAGKLGGSTRTDAWVQVAGPAHGGTTAPLSVSDVAFAAFGGGFVRPDLDLAVLEPAEPRFRFPVLAGWEFVCDSGGDFEALMQGLDVGLLGTTPAGGPQPTVLETGHLEIDHRRRRGTSGRAWYRGPLTPREVARRPATVPFLTADQARRVAADGLEDLSEAAAFEIGRLMALAAPRFVAALRSWARDGFALRRTRRLLDGLGLAAIPGVAALPTLAGVDLLTRLAADGAAPLGAPVPAVDLGPFAEVRIDPERLAAGLGLDPDFVADVVADRPTTAGLKAVLTAPLVTGVDELLRDPRQLDHLGGVLRDELDRLKAAARREEDR
jgi:hypothetical protein